MKKSMKSLGVWVLIFAVVFLLYSYLNGKANAPEEIPYSTLISSIKSEQVNTIEIS